MEVCLPFFLFALLTAKFDIDDDGGVVLGEHNVHRVDVIVYQV